MAPKKRSSAASKKGGASRGKKPASAVASARSRAAQAASARHQTAAILLFAGAVLLLCLVLIPGASLWGLLHKFVLGPFGICAFILPVLMIYIAVIAAGRQRQRQAMAGGSAAVDDRQCAADFLGGYPG